MFGLQKLLLIAFDADTSTAPSSGVWADGVWQMSLARQVWGNHVWYGLYAQAASGGGSARRIRLYWRRYR